jgi:hypothetical protein
MNWVRRGINANVSYVRVAFGGTEKTTRNLGEYSWYPGGCGSNSDVKNVKQDL